MHILENIAACTFFVGLLPILFARSWSARIVAILFGLVSVGLGLYFLLSDMVGVESWPEVRRLGLLAVSALMIAFVSLTVTFRLDRKHETKAS